MIRPCLPVAQIPQSRRVWKDVLDSRGKVLLIVPMSQEIRCMINDRSDDLPAISTRWARVGIRFATSINQVS